MVDRKPVFSFVDSNEDSELPVYCPYCEKVGIKYKLGPRIYDEQEPYDKDQWMQCYRCGKIIPIYEVKEELSYGPIVDIINNPHDSGTEIYSVEKRTGKKRKRKKNDDDDPDMTTERGNVNILYDSRGTY